MLHQGGACDQARLATVPEVEKLLEENRDEQQVVAILHHHEPILHQEQVLHFEAYVGDLRAKGHVCIRQVHSQNHHRGQRH